MVGCSPRAGPSDDDDDEEEDKDLKQERAQPPNPPGYYQSLNRLRHAAGNRLSTIGVRSAPRHPQTPLHPSLSPLRALTRGGPLGPWGRATVVTSTQRCPGTAPLPGVSLKSSFFGTPPTAPAGAGCPHMGAAPGQTSPARRRRRKRRRKSGRTRQAGRAGRFGDGIGAETRCADAAQQHVLPKFLPPPKKKSACLGGLMDVAGCLRPHPAPAAPSGSARAGSPGPRRLLNKGPFGRAPRALGTPPASP